jgi:hypothetical protein
LLYRREMDVSTYRVFLDAKPYPCGNTNMYLHTLLATTTPAGLALAVDRQHINALKWHTRMILIRWLTIGVFSVSRWRNDTNHEPPISLLGPRQLFQSSIKAYAMIRLNFIQVIKTSILISPTRQRSNQPTNHGMEHLYSPYPLSSARPVISACKNPAQYDFNRHTPIISWAQRPQVNLLAFKHQAYTHTPESIDKFQTLAAGLGQMPTRERERNRPVGAIDRLHA